MKKIVLCTVALLYFQLASAQVTQLKNSISVGTLYLHTPSHSFRGLGIYHEYNLHINRYLTFSPTLSYSYSWHTIHSFPYYFYHNATIGTDFNVFVSTDKLKSFRLRLGGGPSTRFASGSNELEFALIPNGSVGGEFSTPIIFTPYKVIDRKYLSIGYSLLVEIEKDLSTKWKVGARVGYSSHSRKMTSFLMGLNIGLNL